MTCDEARESLGARADGELAAAERQAVDAHAASCGPCRSALERLARLDACLRGAAGEDLPDGFADRVLARARTRRRGGAWLARSAAAAALLAGVGLGALMGRDLGRGAERRPSLEAYGLDHLTESPAGSLAEAYLSAASGRRKE